MKLNKKVLQTNDRLSSTYKNPAIKPSSLVYEEQVFTRNCLKLLERLSYYFTVPFNLRKEYCQQFTRYAHGFIKSHIVEK